MTAQRLFPLTSRKLDWSVAKLDSAKALIKVEVDHWRQEKEPKAVLKDILARVKELQDSPSSDDQLLTYVYCVTALVQIERFLPTAPIEIEKIFDVAYAILRVRGVAPFKSRLSSMYGDLHTMRSQIFRQRGSHWAAAWEQHLARRYGGQNPTGGDGGHGFAMGNRHLRMGSFRLAEKYYEYAERMGISPAIQLRLRVNFISALRSSGERKQAAELLKTVDTSASKDPFVSLDVAWESMCIQVSETGDPTQMLGAVQRGQKHYVAGYVTEAVLWSLSVSLPSKDFEAKTPNLSSLRENKTLKIKSLGIFYDLATAIQQSYDRSIPVQTRLRTLGQLLQHPTELVTIDKELLVWLAAARALKGMRSYELAILALSRYEGLSLIISAGKTTDALGIARDLLTSKWYENPGTILRNEDESDEKELEYS